MVRCALLCILFAAVPAAVHAQSTDSLKVVPDSTAAASDSVAPDPLRYRLFAMATGEVMPKGRVAVGLHEIVVMTVNATPVEFLQLGVVVYPQEFDARRIIWAANAKVPVYSSDGFVRAVSAGIGAGTFWPIMSERPKGVQPSYFAAGTFGNDQVQLHVTLNGAFEFDTQRYSIFPAKPLQLGFSAAVGKSGKLIVETLLAEEGEDEYAPEIWFMGFRNFGSRVAWELGAALLPDVNFSGHGPASTIPFPYGSLSFCF